jgi:two-component system cell cycle response regulator CtrA
MRSSRDDVETLLAAIRARARTPDVARLTDQISLLCRAALTPCPDDGWAKAGLTRMEARLMRALAEKPDRLVTKGALMDAMYFDRAQEPEPKIVDVLVCRIRRKLKGSAWAIETVWGQGYRARVAADAARAA